MDKLANYASWSYSSGEEDFIICSAKTVKQ